MYHLLIVDDEPLILESLYQMVSAKKGELFVVFRAGSAAAALELFESNRIDLLMTDIRMPGMDGLSLRDTVLENWPDCLTIFLTGQDNFDYAKEAVDLKTIAFVLKMEGDEALLAAIEKGYEMLEDLYVKKSRLLKLNTHYEETLPILRQYCVKKILGNGEWNEEAKEKLQKELAASHTGFDVNAPFLLAACEIYGVDKPAQEEIRNMLEESIRGTFISLSTFVDMGRCILLAQERGRESKPERLRGFLEIGLHLCGKLGCHKPAVFLYDCGIDIGEAGHAFSILTYRILEMESAEGIQMCSAKQSAFKWEKRETVTRAVWSEERSDGLAEGEEEAYYRYLEELVQWAEAAGDLERAAAFSKAVSRLLFAILNYLPDENELHGKINLDQLVNYSIHGDFWQAMQYVGKSASAYFLERRKVHTDAKGYLVQQINTYILKNLKEDLSMVTLGNLVGLNATYLSRIYKEITGMSINHYIAGQRIGLAKQLLEDSTVKIQRIAELTGMHTSSYFTHYFKKHTGLTPVEYRSKLLNL